MGQRVPIETTHSFVELFADRIFARESKKLAGRVVQISNSAGGIGDNDSLLDGVENGLEKSFLLSQAQQIILHLFRPDLTEPPDQFFEKAGLHFTISKSSTVPA